ncbi:MAG: MFS transporter [Verrucomicrobia subdivision 3 bacterium]|nr:MFS transporter [Limisphaerales bacterium]
MQTSPFRWWVAGMLAAATALNYLDRQALPVVIGEIQKEIPITDQQFGRLQSVFLLAYGIMYAVGGKLIDWLGARAGYALMIIFWSAANFCQGLVSSVLGLGVFRFLLGVGEGGGFPGSAKAVSEWFPARERSFAFGVFNTGSSVGAVIAPPLIALIVLQLNWRWVFFITGSLGIVWAVIWLKYYSSPAASASANAASAETRWVDLLRYRQVWGLVAAKFLSDSAWFFFIFWLPKYLNGVRGLNIKEIGYYAWIPYAFAGAGSFVGGWLSGALLSRDMTLDRARKITLAMSAALMPVAMLIEHSPLSLVIVFFSAVMFAHQFWSTIVQTLAADLFPSEMVGSVAGIMGAAGALGAALFSVIAGSIIAEYGYAPVFLAAGLVHPVSFVIILLFVRRIERLVRPMKLA